MSVKAADVRGTGCMDIVACHYYSETSYDAESLLFWNGEDGLQPDNHIRVHYRGDGSNNADLYVDSVLVNTYTEMTPGATVDFIQWGDAFQTAAHGDVMLDNIKVTLVDPGT
jgi:hypothetical protein